MIKNAPIRLDLPTPFAVGTVNAYLFLEPEPVLIDCGLDTAENREAITTGLSEYGLAIGDLKKVFVTHAHVDHLGGARWIADHSDAEIFVSNLVYPWAVNLAEMWSGRVRFLTDILQLGAAPPELIVQYVDQMKRVPTMWPDVPADRLVRFPIDGGALEFGGRSWKSLYAPGHTHTQSCFYQPDTGWLLSADMLLPIIPVAVIEQPPEGHRERVAGLPQYLVSLDRFEALDVSTVYPGHGSPFTEHRAVIQQQRKRVARRTHECYELVAGGIDTVYGLTEKLYGHYPAVARMTGFSMTVGYLDILLGELRIKREMRDGRWHFLATNDATP